MGGLAHVTEMGYNVARKPRDKENADEDEEPEQQPRH